MKLRLTACRVKLNSYGDRALNAQPVPKRHFAGYRMEVCQAVQLDMYSLILGWEISKTESRVRVKGQGEAGHSHTCISLKWHLADLLKEVSWFG